VSFNQLLASTGWLDIVPNWVANSFPIIRVILMVLLLVSAVLLVVCILFQQTKASGLGAISGGSTETYYYKHKGKSLEGILKKATIILAICTLAFTVLFLISIQIYSPNLPTRDETVPNAISSLMNFIR